MERIFQTGVSLAVHLKSVHCDNCEAAFTGIHKWFTSSRAIRIGAGLEGFGAREVDGFLMNS